MIVPNKSKLQTTNNHNKICILHVDDDPSLLEISKLMLMYMNANFDIDTACCVAEGLSKLAVGQYDAVISDYEMPKKMAWIS